MRYTIRLGDALDDLVEKEAVALDVSKAAVIKIALNHYFQRDDLKKIVGEVATTAISEQTKELKEYIQGAARQNDAAK